MSPKVTSAIALLKAKVKLIAAQYKDPDRKKPFVGNWVIKFEYFERDTPTIEQLRMVDQPLETRLRREFPKKEKAIRAKLNAKFGRSTVGEPMEVVAKRVLKRGRVLNDEDAETIEPIADVQIDYGIELLGEKNANRLTGLWQKFAAPINPAYKGPRYRGPR